MVPVGDIELVNFPKRIHKRPRLLHFPDAVYHAVRGGEGVDRLGCRQRLVGQPGHGIVRFAGEHDRLGVRPLREDVAGAVVLLVGPGQFMLEDAVFIVVADRDAREQSGLGMCAHLLLIQVEAWHFILDKDPVVLHLPEVGCACVVHGVGVQIDIFRQIDLGTDDMQETVRTAFGQHTRLLGIDDIVRHTGHLLDEFGFRTPGSEWMDSDHGKKKKEIVDAFR